MRYYLEKHKNVLGSLETGREGLSPEQAASA